MKDGSQTSLVLISNYSLQVVWSVILSHGTVRPPSV